MSRIKPQAEAATERKQDFRGLSSVTIAQPELDFGLVEVTEEQQRDGHSATRREVIDAIEAIGGNGVFAGKSNRTKSEVSKMCAGGTADGARAMPIEFYDDLATISRPAFEYAMNRFLRRHGYAPLQPVKVATPAELYTGLRRAVSLLGIGEDKVIAEAARLAGLDVGAFSQPLSIDEE